MITSGAVDGANYSQEDNYWSVPISVATRLRFYFVSSNVGWGGSEELWSATAAQLVANGHEVTAFKCELADGAHIGRLRARGCRMRGQVRLPTPFRNLSPFMTKVVFRLLSELQPLRFSLSLRVAPPPDLIVLSQGGNSDGLSFARSFLSRSTPYVVISHKASDLDWPPDGKRGELRDLYTSALACCFVSEHNWRLTEEQLGVTLPQATIVRNPYLVPWAPRTDWPDDRGGLRLACVARLNIKEKGQDILLRVLAREKWRQRPLSVTFYGEGANREGLTGFADFLQLKSVSFVGHVHDVARIWDDHHGLVLPSRCEGLPITVIEAMLSGRFAIVTNVAGNAEVVQDGLTGFIAAAATEDALDEAMERAWAMRNQWSALGAAASTHIRTLVPSDPAATMASLLHGLADRGPELQHPR